MTHICVMSADFKLGPVYFSCTLKQLRINFRSESLFYECILGRLKVMNKLVNSQLSVKSDAFVR